MSLHLLLSNYAVFLAQIHAPISLTVQLYNIWHKFMSLHLLLSNSTAFFGTNSCFYILDCQTLQYFGTNSCSFIFCSQNYGILAQIWIPFVVKLQYLAQIHVPISLIVKQYSDKNSCSFIFSCQPLQYLAQIHVSFIFCCQTTLFGRSSCQVEEANQIQQMPIWNRLHDILEKHEQNIQLHNIKINMTWITLSDYMKYLQPVWSIWVLKQNQLRTTVALNVQFTKQAV